jgi:GNAT superfamily N-acetyltransferase
MEIRAAEPADIDALTGLWKRGWHDAHDDLLPKALADLRTYDSFRERLLAGIEDLRVAGPVGAPLGFAFLKADELYQLYVVPEARGLGVAAVLIADAERQLAARGHAIAWLACAIGNDRAARFYEKSGWRRLGVERLEVETTSGLFPIQIWRYEKRLG